MTLYMPDNLPLYEVSHDISRIIRELLEVIAKKGARVDPPLLRRAKAAIIRAGFGIDDIEFIDDLIARLRRRQYDDRMWEDFSHAIRILAETELRMNQALAEVEAPLPIASAKGRFDELSQLLQIAGDEKEMRDRIQRLKRIKDMLTKRPGLYVSELYRTLTRLGEIKTTYPTVWSDIRRLERDKELITIGGPQGTPRYCFPHPDSVQNRRTYYDSFYGAEGLVEDKLTERFLPTKRFVDVFLVNSHAKPLILVAKFGAAKDNIIGARIKTFGKLHGFSFLRDQEGMRSLSSVKPHDVLRAVNITKIDGNQEKNLWYDQDVFVGYSLYPGSTIAAM